MHETVAELFDLAPADTPDFHLKLKQHDSALEEFVKQQESVQRLLRVFIEDAARHSEQLPVLAEALNKLSAGVEGEGQVALRSLSVALSAEYLVEFRLLKEVGSKFLAAILQGRPQDHSRLREARRSHERSSERYDSVLSRHVTGSMKTSKTATVQPSQSTHEEVKEARRAYYAALGEYIEQIAVFKEQSKEYWRDKIGVFMGLLVEGKAAVSQIYHQPVFEEPDPVNLNALPMIKKSHEQYTVKCRKQETVGSSTNEKHGRLFRKRTKGIGPPWRPVFVSIERGLFRYWPTLISSETTTQTGSATDTNVLLCQIRLYETVERACCFEVAMPQRTLIFQTESEDELLDWLRVFENAKNAAIKDPVGTTVQSGSASGKLPVELLQGVPVELLNSNKKHSEIAAQAPILFHSEPVLCNNSLGSLLVSIREIMFYSPLLLSRIEWSQVSKLQGSESKNQLVSVLNIVLAPKQVDATEGDQISITFYSPQHQSQADMFCELSRLLGGPRKSVPSEQVVINTLYKTSTLGDDLDLGSKFKEEYPDDFLVPQQPVFRELPGDPDLGTEHVFSFNVNLPAFKVYEELFGSGECLLMQRLHMKRGNKDFKLGELDANKKRTFEYLVPISNPIIKARETRCIEEEVVSREIPYTGYLVDITANTPDILYGDAFYTRSRYAISFLDYSKTNVKVWFGMHWRRTVLVKAIIRGAATKGFSDYCADLRFILKEESKASVDGEKSIDSSVSSDVVNEQGEEKPRMTGNTSLIFVVMGIVLLVLFHKWQPKYELRPYAQKSKHLFLVKELYRIGEQMEAAEGKLEEAKLIYGKLLECRGGRRRDGCEWLLEQWNRIVAE